VEKENIVCPGCDERNEELVQNTGCSESNAKVVGRSSILRLKEVSLLRATVAKCVPRGTKIARLTSFFFSVICQDNNLLYLLKPVAHRSIKYQQTILYNCILFFYVM